MGSDGELASDEGVAEAIAPQSAAYRWYAVTLMLVLFMLSFLDRQIINILAEPIKHELQLADWQIGIMSGLAFALLYTIAGIPIARMAEHGNRPLIIGVAVAVWSMFTAACGYASSFVQLLAGRVGVGIGEAGLTPPAMSLIMDYTPPEKRASTLAHYHIGVPLGSLMGLALGGLLLDAVGWRSAFLVVGIPGALLALLAGLTLREPRRNLSARTKAARTKSTFGQTVTTLTGIRTYRLFVLATAFQAFVTYGHAPFTASFFFRMHDAELGRLAAVFGLERAGFLGVALGLATGITGALGVWLGGQLADRASRRDVRAYATIPAIAALLTIPTYIAAVMIKETWLALALMTIPSFLNSLWFGSVHTTQQGVAPPHMRATATAFLLLVLNLIGLGLGPLTVGLMSDWFSNSGGLGSARGVQIALIVSSFIGFVPFSLFWSARRSIRSDLENARLVAS